MKTEQESQTPYHEGVYQKFPREIIQSHIPQYNVVPYSNGRTTRPLSAAQINTRRSKSKSNTFFPKFFMNPYQDLDYMVLQDIYANSIGGRIIDRKEELKFGNGIRPVLKLRNPKKHGDDKAQQKLLEDNQEIIDRLLMVDDALGDPDDSIDPYLDTNVNTKFQALSKNSSVYGRCMIIKEFTKPLVLADGTVTKGIPNILKVIHPRDIGLVEIDQESWKLKSVQIRFTARNILPHQMIYIESGSNNPVYNALHYGFSDMQSMIGASRSLRQMIEVDFPTITKHVWAGIGFMFIKPEGTTVSQKQSELDQINEIARVGRLNNLMIDPENVRVDFQDFQPKIAELVSLADFLIRYNIAQTGITSNAAGDMLFNTNGLLAKYNFGMNADGSPRLQIGNTSVISQSLFPVSSTPITGDELGSNGNEWARLSVTDIVLKTGIDVSKLIFDGDATTPKTYFTASATVRRVDFYSPIGGVATNIAAFTNSSIDLFGNTDLTLTTGQIRVGGALKGMENIGELTFVNNTATPSANGVLYFDGTELKAKTGSVVKNLSDIGSGGGDLWSDPLDADIIPDTDALRNIGSSSKRLLDVWASRLKLDSNVDWGLSTGGITGNIGTGDNYILNANSVSKFQVSGTVIDLKDDVILGVTSGDKLTINATMADGSDIAVGTSTGTKIGTSTTQKLGFFGNTPTTRSPNYTVANGLTDRNYDANSTSTAELADVLGTLIGDLQSLGLIG